MPLEEGQQVLIKNPRALVGIVLKQRPGDKDLPEDQRRYIVRISEDERLYLPSDLEPVQQPNSVLVRYSPEWMAECERWIDAGRRWMANNNDRAAWDEFAESGSKLGFFIPIPQK